MGFFSRLPSPFIFVEVGKNVWDLIQRETEFAQIKPHIPYESICFRGMIYVMIMLWGFPLPRLALSAWKKKVHLYNI